MIRIATWNINSVRLRFDLVEKFILLHKPDILCLQEIKCRDAEFPAAGFHKLGYEHVALHGQKGYHGVATISRFPIGDVERRKFCNNDDARHICVSFNKASAGLALKIHNFYIPAGGDVPDRDVNIKFGHKMDFLDELEGWITSEKLASQEAILLGDLNIAPLETDVWNHKALLKVVSHTPAEVEKLNAVFAAGPWHDAMRMIVPAEHKLFTWWSYRSAQWEQANKGRRLDHIWLSEKTNQRLRGMQVIQEARGWDRPSDHAPVFIDLEV
ncbi:MAG: exodeoxyribonuclease III [Beijerinckiaceae bacterium]|jgi:exodeoxyribonuclease III|nr:exodeoxyribonuclease III [Beijerinckiaceae bacterium]